MGRPNLREQRRAELVSAFAQVLAEQGYEGATIAALAARAGVAPGLIHHYFADKAELLVALLAELVGRFRGRVRALERSGDPLLAYLDGAVALGGNADRVAARCWVGLFAEAVRDPALFKQLRRFLDEEIEGVRKRSGGRLSERDAGALLAFIVGALVLGVFTPRKTAGFAAPALRALSEGLLADPGRARQGPGEDNSSGV